jgi:long-chain acyl-CoA synthetase
MTESTLTEAPVVPLEKVEADTLTKLFLSSVDRNRGGQAMLYRARGEWRPILYREVEQRVARLAAGLEGLGLARGDRVAILSENRPEWAITDFATLFLGAVVVPVYTTLPPRQIAYILRDSGARVVFVSSPDLLAKVREVRDELPSIEAVIAFDSPGPEANDILRLPDVEADGAQRMSRNEVPALPELSDRIQRDDLATLIYTSGTTGDPKGVMLTHYNIASNIAAIHQHDVLDLQQGHVALSFLPLSHSFERTVDYYYWYAGATIAYVAAVDLVAESLVQVQPHVVAAAPRVFEKIFARVMSAGGVKGALIAWAKKVGEATVDERLAGRTSPSGIRERVADRLVFSKLRERTGGRVQAFISGSAPLSAEIAKFFWAAGIRVFEGYGLTETSPVLNVNKPGRVKLGSVGPPIPGTEIRIAENGEILARGPQIMKGYFGRPDATAEAIDSDGWFHTGDIGFVDADGFLWITDRIKNIIVTAGGKNVAPAPIENEVALSPFVAQVVMVGDRRPFTSLLIVPDFEYVQRWAREQGITDTDPAALVRDQRVHKAIEEDAFGRLSGFARYEMPKKIALVPREFTVEGGESTPSLKVKRHVVETNYSSLIEEIYADTSRA